MPDLEQTSNGVSYDWGFAGPDGAWFVVYKGQHTAEEIKEAVSELRRDRDVVGLQIKEGDGS